jgi:hypothetical protein
VPSLKLAAGEKSNSESQSRSDGANGAALRLPAAQSRSDGANLAALRLPAAKGKADAIESGSSRPPALARRDSGLAPPPRAATQNKRKGKAAEAPPSAGSAGAAAIPQSLQPNALAYVPAESSQWAHLNTLGEAESSDSPVFAANYWQKVQKAGPGGIC